MQWHRAILANQVRRGGAHGRADLLADLLREVAVTKQQRPPFRDYRSVLRAGLEQALVKTGHTAMEADHEALWSTLGRIKPRPDVPTALRPLQGRCKLGIISNSDEHLVAGTLAAIAVPIDFVVTAPQAWPPGRTESCSGTPDPSWT